MTLKEMKIKTFSLIEEYYPEEKGLAEDEDVLNKINGVVNQIQLDLMKYRKINAYKTFNVTKEDSHTINLKKKISDLYQIRSIGLEDYNMPNEDILILPNDFEGEFSVYYYKYPILVEISFDSEKERLDEDEDYDFELDSDVLEIMPYGIAADLLKMDMISNYGKYFYERYLEMKNNIDSRKTSGTIAISGGYDV